MMPRMPGRDPRTRKYPGITSMFGMPTEDEPKPPPQPPTVYRPENFAPGYPANAEDFERKLAEVNYNPRDTGTVAGPVPPAPFNFEKEFDSLAPPQRRAVERPAPGKYAVAGQILSGLGDVFAARGGRQTNYLNQNIGMGESMRNQEYGDRTAESERDFGNQSAAYQRGLQRLQVRQGLATRAEEITRRNAERKEDLARATEQVKTANTWRTNEDARQERELKIREAEAALMQKLMGGGGEDDDAVLSGLYDRMLETGADAGDAEKRILENEALPTKERVRRAGLMRTAAQRKQSVAAKSDPPFWMGGDGFSVERWGQLVNQFKTAQDDETKLRVAEELQKMNPRGPKEWFLGDTWDNLPEDVRNWRRNYHSSREFWNPNK